MTNNLTKSFFISIGLYAVSTALIFVPLLSNTNQSKKCEVSRDVCLACFEQPKPQEPVKQEVAPKPQKKELSPKPQKQTPVTPVVPSKQESTEKQTTSQTPQIAQPQKKSAPSSEEYMDINREKIRAVIAKYQTYPPRAHVLRQVGTCVVSFMLHPDGSVDDIKIRKGSGSVYLDRGAVLTIENAASELPKPQKSVTITIPLEYVL
jgi:periplasmic protein TonB